jgi:hypothetical protein
LAYVQQILKDVRKLALDNKPRQLVISNRHVNTKHDLNLSEVYDLTDNSSWLFPTSTMLFSFDIQTKLMSLNLWVKKSNYKMYLNWNNRLCRSVWIFKLCKFD